MMKNNDLKWLSSIRGIAAIFVVLTHIVPYIEHIAGKNTILAVSK